MESHIYLIGLVMDTQVQHSLHSLLLLWLTRVRPQRCCRWLHKETGTGPDSPCGEKDPETLWLPNPRNAAGPRRGAGPSIPPLFPALVGFIQACNSHSWLGQPRASAEPARCSSAISCLPGQDPRAPDILQGWPKPC